MPLKNLDEDDFNENDQNQEIGGDKMIETSFILPINSMKEFPPLPGSLDQSLKESFTTANNGMDATGIGRNEEESK